MTKDIQVTRLLEGIIKFTGASGHIIGSKVVACGSAFGLDTLFEGLVERWSRLDG